MNERAAGVTKKSHAGDDRGIPPSNKKGVAPDLRDQICRTLGCVRLSVRCLESPSSWEARVKDDLERRFDDVLADLTTGSNVHDFELRRAVAALGKAVLRLDRSSTRLWIINIILTVVILGVAVLQVCLMIKGR